MGIKITLPVLAALPLRRALAVTLALALAALLAWWATPRLVTVSDAPALERVLPRSFGDWTERTSPFVQVSLATTDEPSLDQPYDQTVMRAYENSRGQVVFLAVAWGRQQRQEVKIHRPDLCYVAQGYSVKSLQSHRFADIASPAGAVSGKRMLALSRRGGEAVSYWMRIGEVFSEDAVETRLHILREGLAGRVPDGVLVRASMPARDERDAAAAWPIMEAFLAEFTAASPADARALLLGQRSSDDVR